MIISNNYRSLFKGKKRHILYPVTKCQPMYYKLIAILIALLIALTGLFVVTRPMSNKKPEERVENTPAKEKTLDQPENQSDLNAEQAFLDFLTWKKDSQPTLQTQDTRLDELSRQFPQDYRFVLERIRGDAKIKGIHSHTAEFEILTKAAQIAINCDCGDAQKMKADLIRDKANKSNGFWKLSTHPKQWKPIIDALEEENVSLLKKQSDHHH